MDVSAISIYPSMLGCNNLCLIGILRLSWLPNELGPFFVYLVLLYPSISEFVSAYLKTPDEYNRVMNKSSNYLTHRFATSMQQLNASTPLGVRHLNFTDEEPFGC